MIKACFFDIDGTLVSHAGGAHVPASAVRALRELHDKGIQLVVCTGRSPAELGELPIQDIPFDAYLTLNGQLCLDRDKRAFDGMPINEGELEILMSMFAAKKIPMLLIGENGRAINYVNDVVENTLEPYAIPSAKALNGEPIYQMQAFPSGDQKVVLDNLLDECTVTSWSETGLDIIARGGGKDVGIERYLDKVGIPKYETMGFGDGENDIPMFRIVGVGVAMGNGAEATKAAADYVTADIDDDGIMKALRHYGLVGAREKFSYRSERDGSQLQLVFEGKLDSFTAPELAEKVPELLDGVTDVVIDCASLSYLSSLGLRALLSMQKRLGPSGSITLKNVSGDVREILEISGFDSILRVAPPAAPLPAAATTPRSPSRTAGM